MVAHTTIPIFLAHHCDSFRYRPRVAAGRQGYMLYYERFLFFSTIGFLALFATIWEVYMITGLGLAGY